MLSLMEQDTASWSNREFAKKVALLPQVRPVPEIGVGSLVLHGRFPYLGYPRRYSAEDRTIAKEAMRQAGVLELSGIVCLPTVWGTTSKGLSGYGNGTGYPDSFVG